MTLSQSCEDLPDRSLDAKTKGKIESLKKIIQSYVGISCVTPWSKADKADKKGCRDALVRTGC